jgi:hypothetical protein
LQGEENSNELAALRDPADFQSPTTAPRWLPTAPPSRAWLDFIHSDDAFKAFDPYGFKRFAAGPE